MITLGDKTSLYSGNTTYYYFTPMTKTKTIKIKVQKQDKPSVKPTTVYRTNTPNACSINPAATHKISNSVRSVKYEAIKNINAGGKYNDFCDIFEIKEGVITLKEGKTIPTEGVTG